jgi:O-antigen ligase
MKSIPYPAKLWGLMLFSVPLTFNPISRWQYEPDKVALFIACVGLLVGWTLWQGGLPKNINHPIEKWLVGFLLINLLALFTSETPHWGLWGDPAWRNGLLLTLASTLIFVLARRQLTIPERQRPLLQIIILTSTLVSIYGILEHLKLNPLLEDEDPVRASATLAHANLLALYLAMTIPLTLLLIFSGWIRREIGVMSLFLQGVCLIFTYSRAGWLSAMAGVSIFIGLWLWHKGRRNFARLCLIGTLAGLVGLFILSILPPLPSGAPHALQTLTNIFRWKGATAQIRFLGWEASADALRERPLLGYGPASFRYVLEWHLPSELAPFGGAEALGGRTHNRLIEVAIETGIIGLMIYLGLLVALFLPLVRAVFSPATPENTQLLKIGFLAAMGANLVGGLFSFESVAAMMLFWVVAGMAHAQPIPESQFIRRQPLLGIFAGISILAVMLLIIVPDMLAYRSETQCGKHSNCDPIKTMKWAVEISPTPEIFELALANAYAAETTHAANQTVQTQNWQTGDDVFKNLVERHPNIVKFHEAYALYLRRWSAINQDDTVAHRSIEEYTHALALSKYDPNLWLDRGLVWLQIGAQDRALADFEMANDLLENYTRYYGAMSVYASLQNDIAAAQAWQRKALAAQQEWDNWVWRR